MNIILDQINLVGQRFIEFAIPMLVQSSLIILILLLVDVLLRKKVRAGFRYWIWILVLVKLALPTSLSTPVSLGQWLGDEFAFINKGQMIAANDSVEANADGNASITPSLELSSPVSKLARSAVTSISQITWQGLVFLVWLVVVMVMTLLLLQRTVFVRGLVAQAEKVDDSMNDALVRCCNSMGMKRKVGLRISTGTMSPAVCRLFRPVILLPQNMMPSLDASQLRVVLMHELVHIKRHDLLVNLGQTLLQILYFYNPLLWLANAIIRKIREQAVDEAVLITMGEKAHLYPQTLVNVAKLAFKGPTLSLRLIGVVESKSLFEWRIRTMLNRPIPKSSKLGVLGTIMIVAVAAVLLPMAKAQKPGEKSEPVRGENQEEYTKPLHQAVADGDIEQAKLLISRGFDVNEKNSRGKTPLHYACEKRHYEIVKLLLNSGANPRATSKSQNTPLHSAANSGDSKTIEILLSKGADINAKDKTGTTPLFWAMTSTAPGRKVVVEFLLSRGATFPAFHLAAYMGDMQKLKQCLQNGIDVNMKEHGITALHLAANAGRKDVVEFLISKGAQVDAMFGRVWTPLYYAASQNSEDIADLLLANGADVNAKDSFDYTLLHEASLTGDKNAAKLLISKRANVNAKDSEGFTPLMYTAMVNNTDIAKLLITNGANVNARTSAGDTPLRWATGHKETVELLIANGADVNAKNNEGKTPLELARSQGRTEIVELLKNHGAKEDSAAGRDDKQPSKTLYEAVSAGDIEQVKKLISEGADVNAGGGEGGTALLTAIFNDDVDMVRLLIDKGADCNVYDNRGSTPLTWAITALGEKDKEIVELLISGGANINLEGKKGGRTPVYWAAFYGSKRVFESILAKLTDLNTIHFAALKGDLVKVKAFVQSSTDVNTKDKFGCTPLHWAVLANSNDVADFLVAKGADVNAKDNNGLVPLLGARRLDMIGFLISKDADVDAKADTFGYTKLHSACLENDKDMVAFLISKGADVNTKNNWGMMPLHNAIRDGHRELVELLIANGADVNMGFWMGTPLLLAVRGGHRDVAELLILKGADVNAKNKSGQTALDIAIDQDNAGMVELLRKHGAKE